MRLAIALAASPVPSLAAAQATAPVPSVSVVIAGVVRDTGGAPVPGAEVTLLHRGVLLTAESTDTLGRFAFRVLPGSGASLGVRRLGYEPRTVPVVMAGGSVRALVIILESHAEPLDTVRVDAHLAEFTARAASNRFGHFIGEDAVDEMHPSLASDILRHVPGVIVRPSRGLGNTVRIRGCAPLIWIEGERVPHAEVDELVSGRDVAAVEVYSSQAGVPAQYADRSATCGTILIWTRTR